MIASLDSVKLEPVPHIPESPSPSERSGSSMTPLQYSTSHQTIPVPPFPSNSDQGLPIEPPSPNSITHFNPNSSYMHDRDMQGIPSMYRDVGPSSLSARSALSSAFDSRPLSSTSAYPAYSPGQSPRLIDLLLPGTDLSTPPDYMSYGQPQQVEQFTDDHHPDMKVEDEDMNDDEDIEEIPRQMTPSEQGWLTRFQSPSLSSDRSDSPVFDIPTFLFNQPRFKRDSPEMLVQQFDKRTCGILSVRDGPTENPWRTMIFPLVRDSPALFHAISSATAFHSSQTEPAMKLAGVEHMRQSIKQLVSGINSMPTDTALATTLILAFAESWDVHISTGIKHLLGAKALMRKALNAPNQKRNAEETSRLRFLCNTWIYMDVIARLTSMDVDDTDDFEQLYWPDENVDMYGNDAEVDPLMGCAGTLFPIIGRVANLVRKVRKLPNTSLEIISQATEMKAKIEAWAPPSYVHQPEDPTCEIQNCVQTAEAYRWATLLYLHQAVPEVPSKTAGTLANKALMCLATVPISSRTSIVHIYPLLAAGCEASRTEDRNWVRERWLAMSQRMQIGNLDRCWEVVKEVWDRRDSYKVQQREAQNNLKVAMATMGNSNFAAQIPSFNRAFSLDNDLLSNWDIASEQSMPTLPILNRVSTVHSPDDEQNGILWDNDEPEMDGNMGSMLDSNDPGDRQMDSASTSSVHNQNFASENGGWNGVMNASQQQAMPFSGGFAAANGHRFRKTSHDILEELEPARTVRGHLHWISVMQDWKWEGQYLPFNHSPCPLVDLDFGIDRTRHDSSS